MSRFMRSFFCPCTSSLRSFRCSFNASPFIFLMSMAFSLAGPAAAAEVGLAEGSAAAAFFFAASAAEAVATQSVPSYSHSVDARR